jgi:RimJ/RimL family protein N-acetyltransferase
MRIRLVPVPRELDDTSPLLAAGVAAGFGQGESSMLDEVLSTLTRSYRPPPWGSYWGLSEDGVAYCGLCGFKAPPDPAGAVEVAYFTVPLLEGRGIAGAMARELVEIAAAQGARCVLAHTLPVANASGRLLARLGFDWLGPVEDPEDGEVWRWRLRLA